MRLPVPGTIARGSLGAFDPDPEIARLHIFKNPETGAYVTENPLTSEDPLEMAEVLRRGQEQFNITCSVCHGRNGRGVGIVARRFSVLPPSFVPAAEDDHEKTRTTDEERILALTDGEIFETITNGKTTMQPYGAQVAPKDRWAIIHYIRALQYRALHQD
jgi:mono/diheme cytochrome c family protein